MLARVNRVARASDFRTAVRRGRRFTTEHTVLYVADRLPGEPTRFGFIVSKLVGNSVVRHRMTRRFRAIAHDVLSDKTLANLVIGTDIVVRVLPGSPDVSWATLHGEIFDGLERSASRR